MECENFVNRFFCTHRQTINKPENRWVFVFLYTQHMAQIHTCGIRKIYVQIVTFTFRVDQAKHYCVASKTGLSTKLGFEKILGKTLRQWRRNYCYINICGDRCFVYFV